MSTGSQAALADAQKSYDRTKQLVDAKVAAAMDLQTAQAALDQAAAHKQQAIAQVNQAKAAGAGGAVAGGAGAGAGGQAKAAVDLAQVNMEHTIIEAPIDGVVVARNVDVGPDCRRQPAGARALPDRERPDAHAGARQYRRGRRRATRRPAAT